MRSTQKGSHGAAAGAVAGAALGWLIATQPTPFAGLASLAVTGPILAALAGAGAGGALGWIVGLFVGMSLTEYVAKRYAGRIRRGGILLSVHCDRPEWCDRAKKTLRDFGARDVSSASETAGDFGTTDKPRESSPVVVPVRVETPAQPAIEYVPVETKKV